MKTLCLMILLLSHQIALAHENAPRYARTFTDYVDVARGFALERTYNSQSLTNGSFGFGWCSELETSIEPTRDGRLKLLSCKQQHESIFSPVISIQFARRLRPGRGDRQPAFSPRRGILYASTNRDGEQIEFKEGRYELTKDGNTLKRFDEAGRLLSWINDDGVLNSIKRNSRGEAVAWETSSGIRLVIHPETGTNRIRSIALPDASVLSYQYLDENLVMIVKDDINKWSHQYDDLHNLTLSESADGFSESVSYDKLRDRMISVSRGLKIRK